MLAGKEDEVYNALLNVPNLHVYWKEDIPEDYHYTHNRRIMPIVIEADLGYAICNTTAHCDADGMCII